MKKHILSIISAGVLLFTGCVDLDLNPLDKGSSDNWFADDSEFLMAVNELYRQSIETLEAKQSDGSLSNARNYWHVETSRFNNTDRWSDDWNQRDAMYDWLQGNFVSDNTQLYQMWYNLYAGVTRANTILTNITKMRGKGIVPERNLDMYEGEASYFRACFYAYLVFLWGDVPFYTDYLYINDAFKMVKTDKATVLEQVYKDFDKAAGLLSGTVPTAPGELLRVTKGAAYGMKARAAIWQSDWATAAEAAKDCMDLKVYSLHPSFRTLFLKSTRVSPEHIFVLPRSKEIMNDQSAATSRLPRNAGGQAVAQPSWELMFSYLDTDGKPIDESTRYDPKNPFKNRDPRMAETMVAYGSEWLGYVWSPGTRTTLNIATGKQAANNDSRLVQTYSSFNGMCLKKGVDESWLVAKDEDASQVVLRYADVLLMYAEAKMELGEIDNTVLAAVNEVRARAYNGSGLTYPKVTTTDRDELRTIIRMERRMELAWENRRWFDLIRWRLAEVSLTRPIYCYPQTTELEAVISSGNFPFPPPLPEIDENGLVDISPLYNFTFNAVEGGETVEKRAIMIINTRGFQDRQYLMPIPDKDIKACYPYLVQNDGY